MKAANFLKKDHLSSKTSCRDYNLFLTALESAFKFV